MRVDDAADGSDNCTVVPVTSDANGSDNDGDPMTSIRDLDPSMCRFWRNWVDDVTDRQIDIGGGVPLQ